LKAEYERKLTDDAAFADSPQARLSFFFQHSPWFVAQRVGSYQVLRLDEATMRVLLQPKAAPATTRSPL
jgi:hypothetical protein